MTKPAHISSHGSKETMLIIAEDVFAQYSFAGASIRLIAQRSGMSSAMVSYYFGSKEALYLNIFDLRLKEVHEEISRFECLDVDPAKKLRSYLAAYIGRVASNRSFHQLVRNELVTTQHPFIISRLLEARTRIYDFLLQMLRCGIARGYFKTVDEEVFALNILALVPSLYTDHLPAHSHLNQSSSSNPANRILNYVMSMLYLKNHNPLKVNCHE
ncbi:TetR/AcrR family transcriptional regulator [Mucilaginibacter sabulilitoris]|uniref:TetR/AcrR family transcriptional regulator n=1 Tax=Mucilaginibacter sabulilitoris TaxID=1173583 RepID=A0ABZ0TFM8_9SPHI|nr:TetR/AcrR family transcriptional regulator [Mucilaginibacter sabulilitoris]WPU91569.1 TetR/AcrR family transcriptional regulator [Mucilaginibacter sabulilitoris]